MASKSVSIHKWSFSAISVSNCEVACATYLGTPPRNLLFSLTLRKSPHFWIGNVHSCPPLRNLLVDGHKLGFA